MSANEKAFLNELAILFQKRLSRFTKSNKAKAEFINKLIFVPAEGLSIQDALQDSGEMCSVVNDLLQEEDMYVSLDGVSLDNELQLVFQLFVEITDDDLELQLSYVIKVNETMFKANKVDFDFDESHKKTDVWEKLNRKIKGYQIFGALKK